jgi:hypothetical protein
MTAPSATTPPVTTPPAPTTPVVPPPAWEGATSFGDGLYQVGRDIPAGLFRTPGDGDGCYWARLSSNAGSLASIIANDFFTGPSSVTVAATDAFVSFSSGCVWTLDGFAPSNPNPAPAAPVDEVDNNGNPGPLYGDTGSFDQVGAVPVGGVDTGGGPA